MPKRIAIATIGTLGDVLPYIALARALKKHGFDVVLGASSDFEGLIESYNVEFFNLGNSIKSYVTQPSFDKTIYENNLLNLPHLLTQGQGIIETAARKAWVMVQNADAIIVNINTSSGIDMAEALDIPAIVTALQPLNATSEFPIHIYSGPDLGSILNRLTYAGASVQQVYYDLPRDKLRKELMELKPRRGGGFSKDAQGKYLTTLYAYSPNVSAKPHDWPKTAIVTGFWRLEDNSGWKPSKELQEFLDAGEKPIYIGFGSMPFGATENSKIIKKSLDVWGGRAIISSGWGGLKADRISENIFVINNAPHDKLFKCVSAVIHHGGAGTTAAGLYATCPSFILPQAVDQPFWGQRVFELGCGPEPVNLRKLTPEKLVYALNDLKTNKDYKENASKIAKKLNAEKGTEIAIKHIKRVIKDFKK